MTVTTYADYAKAASETLNIRNEVLEQYLLLGLIGELGEIANLCKKTLRGDTIARHFFTDEYGDVLWYFSQVCLLPTYDVEDADDKILQFLGVIPSTTMQDESWDANFDMAMFSLNKAILSATELFSYQGGMGDVQKRRRLLYEVFSAIDLFAFQMQIDRAFAARNNIAKLKARFERGTIKGHRREDEHN